MQNELVIGLSEATYGPTVANSQEPDHHWFVVVWRRLWGLA